MEQTTPARLYTTLVGATLVIVGIIGFFYEASFETGDVVPVDDVFGIFAVNGWHNVVHIALGLIALAMAGTDAAARAYALGFGAVYLVLAIWGFIIVEDGFGTILDIVPVDTADNWLHVVLGTVGIAAGAASPSDRTRQPASA